MILVAERAAGIVSLRRNQELPPYGPETFPAGSKKDLLLFKPEPLSNAGGISVIAYLQRVKKHGAAAAWERGVQKICKNSPADTKVREEGEGRGAPDAGAEVLLQPLEKDVMEQVVLLLPIEDHGGAGEHALKESAINGKEPLRGACCLKGAAAPGAPMLELLLKNCTSWKKPHNEEREESRGRNSRN